MTDREQAIIRSLESKTDDQRLSDVQALLYRLGQDNVIFRLCYNLIDYARFGKRDYKPFERIIKAFEKF